MAIRRSEEQKKDLKMKVYTVVFFLVVGGFIAYYGPFLHKFQVVPAVRDKNADGMLRAASILWWTGRREAAMEVYEDFYLMFRGNEAQDEAMLDFHDSKYGEENITYLYYAPRVMVDRYWNPETEEFREPDIKPVNPEGPAHPRLPEALLRMGIYWEDEKERVDYFHLYSIVVKCFPNADADTMSKAKNGLLRAASRSL